MSRRVSTRRKRPPTRLDADSQPARRRQRVGQPLVDSLPGPLSNVDDLVDKVANAVLMKLQGQHVFNHNTGNEDLLLSTEAPAVQGSVVAEVDHSVISHTNSSGNDAACVSYLDQATTTAATVQGSVAAVLDGLTGTTSVVTKPKDIFVSTNLPIDLSISDRLKTKIWCHEYVDFGLLLNSKKEHTSFHLCVANDSASSTAGSKITFEPNQKSKQIHSIDVWITAFQIFVGVYTQKYPCEAPMLMKYCDIIRDLAARGCNWRYYDENFRYLRQKEPQAYSWGSVHWELWIRSQPSKHNTPQTKKFEGEPRSGILVPKGYCWKYHRGQKCIGCSFKHSCPLCALNHQMVKCSNFRPSKGKSISANPTVANTGKGKQA